ncbi:transporter [Mesorhizobium sp. CN2-181]|uniref:transporter n=1 Tax=Mesorhizobium yinganensis TaxID=3157707 RepID=UPI0032B814BD
MLPAEEIQRSLTGAWRLLLGKADGLRLLDLSVDGFWNSFFSIVVALPAMILGWVSVADQLAGDIGTISRFGVVVRLAVVDLGTWLLPLAVFALSAKPAGLGDRFVAYVVASNWGTVLLVWLMLPIAVLKLIAPSANDATMLLSLLLYIASLVLGWRLTNAAVGKGAAIGTAVFAAMFVASLVVLFTLQGVLGLTVPYSTPTR